jgi:hypothetical protein
VASARMLSFTSVSATSRLTLSMLSLHTAIIRADMDATSRARSYLERGMELEVQAALGNGKTSGLWEEEREWGSQGG